MLLTYLNDILLSFAFSISSVRISGIPDLRLQEKHFISVKSHVFQEESSHFNAILDLKSARKLWVIVL